MLRLRSRSTEAGFSAMDSTPAHYGDRKISATSQPSTSEASRSFATRSVTTRSLAEA